ncbi:glycosyltransferase family 2 protein [Halonatronum saccharophilum]|uniref:glycosyltransferase family 2 protein n=1 Tax=Halonatronum saccharophilum TaxID=150060 RepID=UPI0004881141|nr:glycosyltransferase family 2 protein [Halonatronum saccharophilum]
MNNKLISIVTPLYNSEDYISKTIESVLGQTHQNWELIIVDDCSSDNGVQIVRKYQKQDSRIKLIELKKNSGSAVARNTAIREADGRYIAFLDSDDLWHPQKLEKQIKFMKDNNYAFSFTKYQHMTEESNLVNKYINVPERLSYRRALLINPIGCLTVIYDTKQLGKVYMPLIRKRQDYGLWLKILKREGYGYGLNENLAYYRLRSNSLSASKINLVKYQWKLYREIEELSILESIFYLGCVSMSKVLKVK